MNKTEHSGLVAIGSVFDYSLNLVFVQDLMERNLIFLMIYELTEIQRDVRFIVGCMFTSPST